MMLYLLVLTLHFTEMGGGGDAEITMRFTSESLCKAFRRVLMTQLKDMDGDVGDCTKIVHP